MSHESIAVRGARVLLLARTEIKLREVADSIEDAVDRCTRGRDERRELDVGEGEEVPLAGVEQVRDPAADEQPLLDVRAEPVQARLDVAVEAPADVRAAAPGRSGW